jgi:UDP:flavonoid glycosyltransferase YjiC (YdhE family)
MRVLVTTTGSAGHFGPLVPFARAVEAAGGDVLVATRESTAPLVRAAGYDVAPFADGPEAERNAIFREVWGRSNDEASIRVVSEIFGRIDTRAALPGVRATIERWQPDVVLQEACEFAGALAGADAGVPVVSVAIGLSSVERLVMPATEAALEDVRAEAGLRPGAASAHFTLTPPLLEDPAAPGPAGAHRFRERDGAAPAPLPDWWGGARDPLVYVTFGTVAPEMPFFPTLYVGAIEALAPLPVRVLVTTGRDRDPADLGPLPANVHVEPWIAQADVLPHAAAMVCHGGSGTVRGGLTAGVPMAVLPLFADQPYNAARVATLGAGIALTQGAAGIAEVAGAVEALLGEPRFAAGAAAVADDVRLLPTVDTAAEILRALARESLLSP